MIRGLWIVCALALGACGDRKADVGARRSPLETGIARDLTARFAMAATATCKVVGLTVKCEASLADGSKLPLEISTDHKDWTWHVDGIVVEAKPIADYIAAALADLHVDQTVDCTPAVHVVKAGDRIACKLSGGGLAFMQIAADGTGTIELALDAQAAAARGELVTPERERQLLKISRDLEGRAGESDGEEEVAGDAGVPDDAALR